MSLIEVHFEEDPYAKIPRATACDQRLTAEAVAVLTYLYGHAPGWEPRDSDIQRRFGWGRDRMRTVWATLEGAGYARRRHRVRQEGGRLATVTDVSARPVYGTGGRSAGGGSATGGESAIGRTAGGSTTDNERLNHKSQNPRKTEPVAEGDGKKPDAPAVPERLSFENVYGFAWSPSHGRLIEEGRAVAILRKEGIDDAGQARRIIGEWSATMLRKPDGDPAAALVWACRAELAHTASGDDNQPPWI